MSCFITWDGGGFYFDCTLNERHESKLEVSKHPVEQGTDVTDTARREPTSFGCEVFISNHPIANPPAGVSWANDFSGSNVNVDLSQDSPDGNTKLGDKKYHTFKAPFAPTPGAVFSAVGDAVASVGAAIFGGNEQSTTATVFTFNQPFDAVAYAWELMGWLQDFNKLVTVYTSVKVYENVMLERSELQRDVSDGDGGRFRLSFTQVRQVVGVSFTDAPAPTDPRGKPPVNKGNKGTQDTPPPKVSVAQFLTQATTGQTVSQILGGH